MIGQSNCDYCGQSQGKMNFAPTAKKWFEIDEITYYATLKEINMEKLPCSALRCFENLVMFPKRVYIYRIRLIWELPRLSVLKSIIKITNSQYSSYSAILVFLL